MERDFTFVKRNTRSCRACTKHNIYDALGRPVSRNNDAFGCNERSEVTSAIVADTPARYGYDGNSTNWPANSLNQYAPFGYDADGNMTQCEGWEYAYDAANQLSSVSSNRCSSLLILWLKTNSK